jgi:hypothetical protein
VYGSEHKLVCKARHRYGLKGKEAAMIKKKIVILFIIVSISLCSAASGTEQSTESKQNGKTYVLIVSGINKDSKDSLVKNKAVTDLTRFFLNNAGVMPERLRVLVDKKSTALKGSAISTAENFKGQMDKFAASMKSRDRFIFYYTGQANVVSGTLRLNLPGPDITHEQLAEWINPIKASSMLIVLDCPGAGLAIKALTGQGRIIIGACTAEQHYSTKFSEYFVPALVDENEDSDTNGDGRISLLEAFTSASKGIDDFYRVQSLLTTETPVLEDNADGSASRQPWRYEQNNTDGLAASRFFLSGG